MTTSAPPTLVPTGRGVGALAAFGVLAGVSLITGSQGALPLLVAVGITLVVAPLLAWARGGRALAGTGVRVLVRAVPATVPVGGACSLQVLVAAPGRKLPPIGLERPERRWRLGRRLSPASPAGGSPEVLRPAGVTRRPRRHLAPGPLGLLPLTPADRPAPSAGNEPAVTSSLGVPTGRRGVLRVPSLQAWTHDPLGLFAVPVAATRPVAVVVHPQPIPPPPAGSAVPDALLAGGDMSGPAAPWWAAGGCGDFTDLRPYVPGDRLHLLDWPALARYDRLMVRRFDPEVAPAARIVLDDRAGVHRRAAFEVLLSTMLGLVAQAVDQGRPAEVWTWSGLRFSVAPTPTGIASFLPVAAVLDPRHRPGAGAGPVGWDTVGWDTVGWDTVGWETVGGDTVAVLTTATGAERLPVAVRREARVVVPR